MAIGRLEQALCFPLVRRVDAHLASDTGEGGSAHEVTDSEVQVELGAVHHLKKHPGEVAFWLSDVRWNS